MIRAGLLCIALLLVAVLVARDRPTTSAHAAVKRAVARTAEVNSSRFVLNWTSQGALDDSSHYRVVGVIDYVRRRGRITEGSDSEVIFDGRATYTRWSMPGRNEPLWLRHDATHEPDSLDLQDRILSDPVSLLKVLNYVGTDVDQVGSGEVRGTPTVHYEGTLDLQEMDDTPTVQRAALQGLVDLLREDQPATVRFELWVDGQGIAHRLLFDPDGGVSMLIDYYDFGIPVTITVPRSHETIDHAEWFRELERWFRAAGPASNSGCKSADASANDPIGKANRAFKPGSILSASLPETGSRRDPELIGDVKAVICLHTLTEDESSGP